MTRRRKMACLVVALATLLFFGLGEVVVRLYVPQTRKYRRDDVVGYTLRPGYDRHGETINEQGLRDELVHIEKPAGVRRVVAIGDSFTFGAGVAVDESYPEVLESLLGDGVQVVNAGVPGYSTANAALWLKTYGMKYGPDVVTLGFFLGNDLWENVGSGDYIVVDRALTLKPGGKRKPKKHGFLRRMRNKSQFYRLLKKLPRRLFRRVDHEQALEIYWDHTRSRMGVCAKGEPAKSWEPGWKIARERLEQIRDLAKPAPVVVLAIPDEFQINPAVRAEVVRRYGIDEADYDWLAPNRRLAELCRELGLTLVDVSADFQRRIAAGETLYIPPLDAHWNARGQHLAAEALAKAKPLAALAGK